MTEAPATRRMALCLALSILLHVAAGVLLTWRALGGGSERPDISPDEPLDELASSLEEAVRLGSQTSTATSITWIGFDEYKEHTARPGKVDQAAFTTAEPGMPSPAIAAGSAGAEAPPIAEATPTTSPAPAGGPRSQPPDRAPETLLPDVAATGEKKLEEPAIGKRSPPPVLASKHSDPNDESPSAPDQEQPSTPAPQPEASQSKTVSIAEPAPPRPEGESEKPVPTVSKSPPRQAAAPTGKPGPASTASPAQGEGIGQHSDRESDPTSVDREVSEQQLGQPLSAKGLEIKTVRPRFTHYTRLTAKPIDPTVRLRFDRTGKVCEATFTRSSGIADVDRPLLDALYQWRAVGVELERIPENDPAAGIVISFRILL